MTTPSPSSAIVAAHLATLKGFQFASRRACDPEAGALRIASLPRPAPTAILLRARSRSGLDFMRRWRMLGLCMTSLMALGAGAAGPAGKGPAGRAFLVLWRAPRPPPPPEAYCCD